MPSTSSRSYQAFAQAGRGVGNALGGFVRGQLDKAALAKQEEEKLLRSLMEQKKLEDAAFQRQVIPYEGASPSDIPYTDPMYDARLEKQPWRYSWGTEAGQKANIAELSKPTFGASTEELSGVNRVSIKAQQDEARAKQQEALNKLEGLRGSMGLEFDKSRLAAEKAIADSKYEMGLGQQTKEALDRAKRAESNLAASMDEGITPPQIDMMRQGKVLRGSSMELPGVGGVFPPELIEGSGDFLTVRKQKTPAKKEAKPGSYTETGEGEETVVEPLSKVLGMQGAAPSKAMPLPKNKADMQKNAKYEVNGEVYIWDGEKLIESK